LNHFDGYYWTFPKGHPEDGELPIETAVRETLEETGVTPIVIGHVRGKFAGTPNSTSNYFYLMSTVDEVDVSAIHDETSALRWAGQTDAAALIGKSTNSGGRSRDLLILSAAFDALERI